MLVCGQVNPPPLDSNYNGVFFGENDNMVQKARDMKGIPLQLEHNPNCKIGEVVSGWIAPNGSMYALAEIHTSNISGAVTAAAIDKGKFKEFSLGYKAVMERDPKTGGIRVKDKNIMELSIVKKGAREGCCIELKER